MITTHRYTFYDDYHETCPLGTQLIYCQLIYNSYIVVACHNLYITLVKNYMITLIYTPNYMYTHILSTHIQLIYCCCLSQLIYYTCLKLNDHTDIYTQLYVYTCEKDDHIFYDGHNLYLHFS